MRVLNTLLASVFALGVVAMLFTTGVTPASAHPPPDPDHGLNESAFYPLWSGDSDDTVGNLTGSGTGIRALSNVTDVPFNTPPIAVEDWNRGDLEDFPRTDAERSIHPPNATLSDGAFIRDAYAGIFAVQPSTLARLSPTDQPLYVAPNGSVLGTVDYRLDVPANTTAPDRRVNWTLSAHEVTETRLTVDGEVETTAGGAHTSAIAYSSLDAYPGRSHTLGLSAEINATVEKHVATPRRTCPGSNASANCSSGWLTNRTTQSESVTVADSITVVAYDLAMSGLWARYPDGDLGLLAYKSRPWLGYSLPRSEVHGVWRFYTSRDPEWDALVESTASGMRRSHSPLHPLQVVAYPSQTGVTVTPSHHVSILETYGVETASPTFPSTVTLDAVTEPYVASYGIATRTQTIEGLDAVTAHGLVRGVSVEASEVAFRERTINRSRLAMTVVDTTEETVTVRIRLTDARTNAPINTTDRGGFVRLNGDRLNTSGNGTATRTVSRSGEALVARYEPGQWWADTPGYVGDSDVMSVRRSGFETTEALFRILVPVALFLCAVFLVDRVTGWGVWPPWRRM